MTAKKFTPGFLRKASNSHFASFNGSQETSLALESLSRLVDKAGYVGVNLDLLFDPKHLGSINDQEPRKEILRAFFTACMTAVPGARRNSMNGNTLPFEVLGIRKPKGQPLQLVNAFEKAIPSGKSGHAGNSKAEMLKHHEDLKKLWGIETTVDVLLTDVGLKSTLLNPVWGVWFGRKTCIPASPLSPVIAPSPREALAALLHTLGREVAEIETLEGVTESEGEGAWFPMDQPSAFGHHHGAVPAPYHSRPVRGINAADLT